ncbi:hypothetical protein [Dechloromonas hortensis]|uniref:hypothetical protein n=1 Tax=Dechloromonas hortensis TaxID=337779 RepID=UPI00129273E6|nr:hypothetical protein [Dechloromonas hortensis]
MSGPKVVRVITREERVSQCLVVLARLDQALAIWQESCQRMEQPTKGDQEKALARRNELESMFRSDQFDAFMSAANGEVSFLESDLTRRQADFVDAKAREASRHESGLHTARTLLSALKNNKAQADMRLFEALEQAASGKLGREEVDKLLAQCFKSLSPAQETVLSPEQRELANRLKPGIAAAPLEQWKAPSAKPDLRSEAIARGLAELSLNAPLSLVEEFGTRLDSARGIPDTGQRNLRLDSLIIEINEARLRAIRSSALVSNIKLLEAELRAFGKDAEGLKRELQAALGANNPEQMEAALHATRTGLSALQKQKAAAERRHVVLQGLAKLGYAVNEGMATALTNAGRVVVQKPDFPGYGIELLGGAESERLQVRTVALASARDTTRDTDAEQRWCSDFTKLRADLGTSGTQITIEQARAVGEVPLKIVELATHSNAAGIGKQNLQKAT